MATLTLFWSSDPDALLARAAAPFAVAGRVTEPLPLLAVRQGGIRDAVHELAARAGCHGWLGAPVIVFSEIAELLAGELAPLTPFERRALLASCLAAGSFPIIGRVASASRGEQRLDALIGDLITSAVDPDVLAARLAVDGRDAWTRQRDDELVALYSRYLAAVAALGPLHGTARTDGRDAVLQAARAVRDDPAAIRDRLRRPFDASDRRSIHLYGLADLRRGWGTLIDALHGTDCVDALRIYVTAPGDPFTLDAADFRRVLAERAEHIEQVEPRARPEGLAHLRDTLFRPSVTTIPTPADVRGIAAPDMQRELEIVVRRVKRLIVDNAVRPASIAIVARKARPYANRAIELLDRAGVPATARLRHTLSEVPVLRVLLRILASAGDGWSVATLEQLAASPYLDLDIDTALLARIQGTSRPRTVTDWTAVLDGALAATRKDADPDGEFPDAAQVERAREQFARFAVAVRPLERARTLGEWIPITLAAVGCPARGDEAPGTWPNGIFAIAFNAAELVDGVTDRAAAAALRDALRLDVSAIRNLVALLNDWRSALMLLPPDDRSNTARCSGADWARELEAVLENEEVGLRTSQRDGVQVVEALAADGRPFDHVFIVGISSGEFPLEPARSALFSDAERVVLHARGLPFESAGVWLAREASLFQSLVNSGRTSLTLSYSYADGSGTPQLASAYYDDVASRFIDVDGSSRWELRPGGSERVAGSLGEAASASELALYAAHAWRAGSDSDVSAARSALAELGRTPETSILVERILHSARAEHERALARGVEEDDRTLLAHAWNGRIDDPATLGLLARHVRDRTWSATSLETYGRCGFSYLAQRLLNADELRDDEVDESAAERGTLLHAILADVYRTLGAELGDAPMHAADDGRVAVIVREAVTRALDGEGALRVSNDGLRAARARQIEEAVRAYVRWEIERSEERKPAPRRPLQIELGFGNAGDEHPPLDFTDGMRTFRLRGRIDRVDAITDANAAGYLYLVDHKTGGGSLKSLGALREGGALLQLQLYMHAVARLLGSDRIFGGAYQIISDLSATGALDRASLVKAGLKLEATDRQRSAAQAIADAPSMALDLIDAIAAGRFAARTPGSTPCLSYCALRHACREERIKHPS